MGEKNLFFRWQLTIRRYISDIMDAFYQPLPYLGQGCVRLTFLKHAECLSYLSGTDGTTLIRKHQIHDALRTAFQVYKLHIDVLEIPWIKRIS